MTIHVFNVSAGVSQELIERMKREFNGSTDAQKIIGVMLDEMKIKSGLVFDK